MDPVANDPTPLRCHVIHIHTPSPHHSTSIAVELRLGKRHTPAFSWAGYHGKHLKTMLGTPLKLCLDKNSKDGSIEILLLISINIEVSCRFCMVLHGFASKHSGLESDEHHGFALCCVCFRTSIPLQPRGPSQREASSKRPCCAYAPMTFGDAQLPVATVYKWSAKK